MTCEEATIISGYHNTAYHEYKVRAGYRFNELGGGSWHDIIPTWHREDGQYFRRISDAVPAVEFEEWNKTRKTVVSRTDLHRLNKLQSEALHTEQKLRDLPKKVEDVRRTLFAQIADLRREEETLTEHLKHLQLEMKETKVLNPKD